MDNNSLWLILHRLRIPFLVIVITYTISITGLLLIPGVDSDGNKYYMSIFDAFYFITYTATTIGFGEIPYAFTYAQRIWVSMSVYITVLGWFYGIGTVISLLQDKLFLNEIAKARFIKNVKKLREPFVIVLGYSHITSQIIRKIQKSNLRAVVVESDEYRAHSILLEGFTPYVPYLVADAAQVTSLKNAGINHLYCKAVISLFEDDNLNLRTALTAKSLNPKVKVAVKSTSTHHSENLLDIGAEFIQNPFSIIASQIRMALFAPNLLKLEQWVYKLGYLNDPSPVLPQGKYIICGYGKMGRHIFEIFQKHNIESTFIEINEQYKNNLSDAESRQLFFADGDDKDNLLEAGVMDSVAIIAGTNDDTINLSILATAKKLNKKIVTIARENEFEDISIFQNANIDHVFMPSKILIHKTANAIIHPLSDMFVDLINKQDEAWGQNLVNKLITTIDENPKLFEISINKKSAPQIFDYLINSNNQLNLKIFHHSLHNRSILNNIVPLMLKSENSCTLLPSWDHPLSLNDTILFACDKYAMEDIEYIAQNINEFYYVLTGEENSIIGKFLKERKQ